MGSLEGNEVYISVDVETSGPIPATYSLLSLGASVVGDPERHFYAELRPLNGNAVPEALAVSGLSLEELAKKGEAPEPAMTRFGAWVEGVSRAAAGGRTPVFVAFNAGFDWSFVNWYFHTYLGKNPFGFAPLDMKAYYMGLCGCRWGETTSSKLAPQFRPARPARPAATHHALDDARTQAETFAKLLSAVRRGTAGGGGQR